MSKFIFIVRMLIIIGLFMVLSPTVSAEPKNIALSGTATSIGFYSSGAETFTPDKIIDGEYDEETSCGAPPRTYWLLPNRQTGWVQIDLGTNHAIEKIRWLNTHNRKCV